MRDAPTPPPPSRDPARRRFLKTLALSLPALAVFRPPPAAATLTDLDVRRHLDQLARQVDLQRRFQWTAVPPRLDCLRPAAAYSRLTVHHTGTGTNLHRSADLVAADIENVMTGHRNRRFGDIGYHFIVDRAGRAWEGRSLRFIGAHVSAENEENIGVMLLGNFENQRPSDAQVASLHRLAAALRRQFAIPPTHVYGHRDLGHTLCPGRYLYGYVGGLRGG